MLSALQQLLHLASLAQQAMANIQMEATKNVLKTVEKEKWTQEVEM